MSFLQINEICARSLTDVDGHLGSDCRAGLKLNGYVSFQKVFSKLAPQLSAALQQEATNQVERLSWTSLSAQEGLHNP